MGKKPLLEIRPCFIATAKMIAKAHTTTMDIVSAILESRAKYHSILLVLGKERKYAYHLGCK